MSIGKERLSSLTKKIAIYGPYVASVPVRQRYVKWVYHRKGGKAGQKWYKRRIWKKTSSTKKELLKGRYEFHGKGNEIYKAIVTSDNIVPKGFIDISAKKFLSNPMKYGYEGFWLDRQVTSG